MFIEFNSLEEHITNVVIHKNIVCPIIKSRKFFDKDKFFLPSYASYWVAYGPTKALVHIKYTEKLGRPMWEITSKDIGVATELMYCLAADISRSIPKE